MSTLKIFIADDHPILLKGLQDLLLEKKFNVVGKAVEGRSALNFIIKNIPDIAILDVEMPFYSGLEIAEYCKKNKLKTKIILITLHKDMNLYLASKKNGVFGYLLKEFALDEIENCIITVSKQTPYFSEALQKFIGFTEESSSILTIFSVAEKRILKLIAQHKSNKEIGHLLFLSPRTVEKYRSKIILKLDLPQQTRALYTWVQKNKHLFN
ncbi:DNA-binding response regulator [Polaribacter sp. WD7]|uniref:response regulator transcription factor n=1 Tax=Polaribacter sp. WD7 TaxID=2269061 RepID=UPI000DF32766|nr:response regulator transcription factor [Polaribacter sp. WD7]RCS27939.1 DNA-binding response regulator [Polaribacter sp. WD7]